MKVFILAIFWIGVSSCSHRQSIAEVRLRGPMFDAEWDTVQRTTRDGEMSCQTFIRGENEIQVCDEVSK